MKHGNSFCNECPKRVDCKVSFCNDLAGYFDQISGDIVPMPDYSDELV